MVEAAEQSFFAPHAAARTLTIRPLIRGGVLPTAACDDARAIPDRLLIEKDDDFRHLEFRTGPLAGTRLRIAELINAMYSEAARPSFPPLAGSGEPEPGSLVRIVMAGLEDAKAEDATLIDLHGKTSIADAMVIATGRSTTHVASIADRVVRALKDANRAAPRIEGLAAGDWVLIDAGDVIVHLFRPEVRQFYNLERMWGADRPSEPRAV